MEKFKQSETVFIKRSQINFAPYNPRKENKKVVEALKKNFKKVGFLGGIQWNPVTGNLIGGHKRLQALDLIHKYDGTNDYDVKVEKIELDEKTEKEQNILLNNKRVQGEMDYDLLAAMLPDIDVEATGLDEYDLNMIEAIVPDFEMGDNERIKEEIDKMNEDAKSGREHVKQVKNKMKDIIVNNQSQSYFVVTFKTVDEKEEFLESIGINGDFIYLKGDFFLKRLNEE